MKTQFLLHGLAAMLATGAFCPAAISQAPAPVPAAAGEAKPTVVDLADFDCRTLLKMNGEYRDNAILFLHGYVSGQKKETKIDLAPLATATDKIIDYCISNPNANALTAFLANR